MLFFTFVAVGIKKNIPNVLTLGNLFCGCLAIIKIFQGDLVWAAYLVGIAGIFDFLDGFAARLLKVSSPIGKDLDSLADMVTFGVVPGFIMFKIISCLTSGTYFSDICTGAMGTSNSWLPYLSFLIPLFSAVRLAKFNNDTRQSESFIGLPTPANAFFIASIPLIFASRLHSFRNVQELRALDPYLNSFILIAIVITVLQSFLLVAPLPLFALKFKNFNWKGNEIRFIFLIWSIVLLAFLQFMGVPLIILSYVLFSVVNNFQKRNKSNPDPDH